MTGAKPMQSSQPITWLVLVNKTKQQLTYNQEN